MKYFAKIEPKNIVTITSTIYFGRGRGRGAQAPSSRGKGAGRRRGAYKTSAADFLVYSQTSLTSQSRKRNKIYPEKSKSSAKFCSDLTQTQILMMKKMIRPTRGRMRIGRFKREKVS